MGIAHSPYENPDHVSSNGYQDSQIVGSGDPKEGLVSPGATQGDQM